MVPVEFYVKVMYENKFVFSLILSTQPIPSRLSCAVMMSHLVLHSQRTVTPWGMKAGRMTKGTPWTKVTQRLLELEGTEWAFTVRWPVQMLLHQDLSGSPMGSSSVRFVGWSALDPMCWWCTSVATQVRTCWQGSAHASKDKYISWTKCSINLNVN